MRISRKLKIWIQDYGKACSCRYRIFLKCEAIPTASRLLAEFSDKKDATDYRDAQALINDAEVEKKIQKLKDMGYKS